MSKTMVSLITLLELRVYVARSVIEVTEAFLLPVCTFTVSVALVIVPPAPATQLIKNGVLVCTLFCPFTAVIYLILKVAAIPIMAYTVAHCTITVSRPAPVQSWFDWVVVLTA